jgi:hypothetical protein
VAAVVAVLLATNPSWIESQAIAHSRSGLFICAPGVPHKQKGTALPPSLINNATKDSVYTV